MACVFCVGGKQCQCRRDKPKDTKAEGTHCHVCSDRAGSWPDVATRPCLLIRLPYSSHEGNSKTIQGVKYSSLQVRKDWRLPLLQSLGLQGVALGNEVFEKEYRVYLCHFAPEDVAWTETKEPFLRFDARAVAPRSVQVALPATTPTPGARVLKRTTTALDSAAASAPSSASPLKIARRALDDHSKLQEECARLETELEVWKKRSAEHQGARIAAETLLAARSNKQSLLTELGASPTEKKYITTTHWSFRRLQCDPLLSKHVQGLVGWPSVRAFELFFDLCMAYTRGQTPRAYRRDALERKDDQRQAVFEVPLSRSYIFDLFVRTRCSLTSAVVCPASRAFPGQVFFHLVRSPTRAKEHENDGARVWVCPQYGCTMVSCLRAYDQACPRASLCAVGPRQYPSRSPAQGARQVSRTGWYLGCNRAIHPGLSFFGRVQF